LENKRFFYVMNLTITLGSEILKSPVQ